jgi:hypothetical protein
MAAFDVGLLSNMGSMTVAVADKIIVASTCKGISMAWHVGDENLASSEFKFSLFTMVGKKSAGFGHHPIKRRDVADIVAMYGVDRDIQLQGSSQSADSDQITAVDDRLRTLSLSLYDGRHKGVGAVMTIGNNANLHSLRYHGNCGTLGRMHGHSVYNHIGWVGL